jgi:formiminotetrahydrofolate cyclodeaminase
MTDIDSFLADLASDAPVPGGGSVAALQVAMAAALLEMVSNLTLGRKRYADVEAQVLSIRERAGISRARARKLIDEDAAAYGAVAGAMKLPKASDDEKAVRTSAIQASLKAAAIPPLETMRLAAEMVDLARELLPIGNRTAASDVGTAAASALSGYEAARLNVEINAASVRDAHWVARARNELEAIGAPEESVRATLAAVEAMVRGDA